MQITKLIEELRKPLPADLPIMKGTVPIPYFGNYSNIKGNSKPTICTIGINPLEFKLVRSVEDHCLSRKKKFNKEDTAELTDENARDIITYCDEYFTCGREANGVMHNEDDWFLAREKLFQRFPGCESCTYQNGSAVHIDMVPWTTSVQVKNGKNSSSWRDLRSRFRKCLIKESIPLFTEMLNWDFAYIFLIGRTVIDTVKKMPGFESVDRNEISFDVKNQEKRCKAYFSKYKNSHVIACSFNIGRQGGTGMIHTDKKNDYQKVIDFAAELVGAYRPGVIV
jgi:hypothetical protein